MRANIRQLIVITFLLVGSGCGGGGDGGQGAAVPAAPVLDMSVQTIKTFHFTWADVSGESEYRLMEDADSASGYTRVATITADAQSFDLEVLLPLRINARYVLQSCNAAGCADSAPVQVGGSLAEAAGYMKASNTGVDDDFGLHMALAADGNTLAVGASGEDSNATGVNGSQVNNSAANSGAVYVFVRNGAGWSQQAYIKASNTGVMDYFGESIALSADGNTLAVGASGESGNATGVNGNQADNSAANSGAVYVFVRSNGIWSQQAYVKASNTEANDVFGRSVALSAEGNTLAVGAGGESSSATGVNGNQADNSATSSGAVYIFTRGNNNWTQQAYVKATNTGASDSFGTSVALAADGNTLAIGASGEDLNSGAAYVFVRSVGVWSPQSYIKASNPGPGDYFAFNIALSADGDTLAVGALYEASNATGINGNQADNSAPYSGAVYLFTHSNGNWGQQAYIKAGNSEGSDYFGNSVALAADGNTLAVGAYGEDSYATGINGDHTDNSISSGGAVYVFTRSAGSWSQRAYVKAGNPEKQDYFGSSVALSADSKRLFIGATGEDSNATGINGNQNDNSTGNSGAVYLY